MWILPYDTPKATTRSSTVTLASSWMAAATSAMREEVLFAFWELRWRQSAVNFPVLTSLKMYYICVFFKAWSPMATFTVFWSSLTPLPARARPATKSCTPAMHCGGMGWWQLTVYRPAWLAPADSARQARFRRNKHETWRHTFYFMMFILQCTVSSKNGLSGLNLTAPRRCGDRAV